jgi:hypothetical protein
MPLTTIGASSFVALACASSAEAHEIKSAKKQSALTDRPPGNMRQAYFGIPGFRQLKREMKGRPFSGPLQLHSFEIQKPVELLGDIRSQCLGDEFERSFNCARQKLHRRNRAE